MKRGDIVVAAASGEYANKARPWLVVQSDHFAEHPSVTLLLITSTIQSAPIFRITIDPSAGNGLQKVSQIAIDKIVTLPSDSITRVIGTLDPDSMVRVTRALAVWLGLAG